MASRATAFSDSGFTLTELAIAVAIVGILTGIALPNYFNAVQRARQSDASSQIMTILTSVQAYREEFLEVPNSWDDIAQITPVMTDNGIATGALTTPITTPNGGAFSNFLRQFRRHHNGQGEQNRLIGMGHQSLPQHDDWSF